AYPTMTGSDSPAPSTDSWPAYQSTPEAPMESTADPWADSGGVAGLGGPIAPLGEGWGGTSSDNPSGKAKPPRSSWEEIRARNAATAPVANPEA
ncbi:unnamed protein product, partial [Polarella glacialis]